MRTPASRTRRRRRRRGGGGVRLRRVVLLRLRVASIAALRVGEIRRRDGSGGCGGAGGLAAGRAELATEALRAQRPQRQTDGLPEADQQVVELRPELSAKETHTQPEKRIV